MDVPLPTWIKGSPIGLPIVLAGYTLIRLMMAVRKFSQSANSDPNVRQDRLLFYLIVSI